MNGDEINMSVWAKNTQAAYTGEPVTGLSTFIAASAGVGRDDLTVKHIEGPIIRTLARPKQCEGGDDYYPFGLTFNSSERSGFTTNKFLYNGNELQTDLNLGLYDYGARFYNPSLARFTTIDPLADSYFGLSSYSYCAGNPVASRDENGEWINFVIGAAIGAAVDYGFQVASNYAQGKSGSEAWTDVDGGQILISAVAGAATSGTSSLTSTTAKVGVNLGIDAAESMAKQMNQSLNSGNSITEAITDVTLEQTLSDVTINQVTGNLTKNIKPVDTKVTTRQLDRAKRVAANDPSSSGRANTVANLESQLSNMNATNEATKSLTTSTVGNAVQKTSDAIRSDVNINFQLDNTVQQDATRVQTNIPIF